jgi:hypothetical protein
MIKYTKKTNHKKHKGGRLTSHFFIFTAETERHRELENQLFIPLRLSASAVKITFETPSSMTLWFKK